LGVEYFVFERVAINFDLIQVVDFTPAAIDKARAQALLIVPTMSLAALGIR